MTFLELEKKCKERRLKRRLLIFFVVVLSLGAGVYIFKTVKNPTKKVVKNSKSLVKKEKKEKKQVALIKKPLKTVKEMKNNIKEKAKKRVLLPDLNFSLPKENKRIIKKEISVKKQESSNKFLDSKILPSYETCIKLAKSFYEKKDYENALKWAKNANIQNNKREDSWIITAMSLYNMGKKKEAIKVLKIYYNYNKSEKIKKLLKDLDE